MSTKQGVNLYDRAKIPTLIKDGSTSETVLLSIDILHKP